MATPGKLAPLLITGYKDEGFSSEVGKYTVMFNPEKYSHSFSVDYNNEQETGTPNTTVKFDKMAPSKVSFELVFDTTGAAKINQGASSDDLPTQIKNFQTVAYSYNGEIHSPNYLELTWGQAFTFTCRLTTMTVNYSLFKSDGTPIRAKANVEFVEFQDPRTIANESEKTSPDLTHIRTVKAGDTLPGMTHGIYGDSQYYVQVAAFNNLNDFRNLQPGQQLIFPPLSSTN